MEDSVSACHDMIDDMKREGRILYLFSSRPNTQEVFGDLALPHARSRFAEGRTVFKKEEVLRSV